MIPNKEKRRTALSCNKTLSALLHGITSKHKGVILLLELTYCKNRFFVELKCH